MLKYSNEVRDHCHEDFLAHLVFKRHTDQLTVNSVDVVFGSIDRTLVAIGINPKVFSTHKIEFC